MDNVIIYSSSQLPLPTAENKQPCGSVLAIPTNQNSYARIQQTETVTVASDATIPFNLLVTDFTDSDFSTTDFLQLKVRKGVYHMSFSINISSVAGGQPRLGVELVNSREVVPQSWSATASSGIFITLNGSYIIEFLEDATVEMVNRVPADVNISDYVLNLIKLKNY